MDLLFLLFGGAGDIDRLAGIGVDAGLEHRGGEGHGCRSEVLNLLGTVMHLLRLVGEVLHRLLGTAGMGRDEIRDELLVQPGFLIDTQEELPEAEVVLP